MGGTLSTLLVLMPGLDGTGDLFANFVSALRPCLNAKIVRYPRDHPLSYADLFCHLVGAVPQSQPFVLVTESFSTPLAVRMAATNPSNLKGLVISAGLIRNPVQWRLLRTKSLVQPWLFRIPPPRFVIEHFLIGKHAPRELRDEVCRTLRSVSAEALACRVRAVMTCDVRADVARIRVPILYLQGEHDQLVSKSSFEEIHMLKPDATLAVINAPHLVLQREPRKSADVVTRFVAELPS